MTVNILKNFVSEKYGIPVGEIEVLCNESVLYSALTLKEIFRDYWRNKGSQMTLSFRRK